MQKVVPLPFSRGSSTRYSHRLLFFLFTIPRCQEFLSSHSQTLKFSAYGMLSFFNYWFSLNRFPVCFNLFVLQFLVTIYLLVAVQPCMQCIPIKNVYIYIYIFILSWYFHSITFFNKSNRHYVDEQIRYHFDQRFTELLPKMLQFYYLSRLAAVFSSLASRFRRFAK